MIEIGSMSVRDLASIVEVRGKVLGLMRSLGAADVLATCAATGVSEEARRRLVSFGGATIDVALGDDGGPWRLRVRFDSAGRATESPVLGRFFERVVGPQPGTDGCVTAELTLSGTSGPVDPRLVANERERIARKSRSELLEELQSKNRQLEAYNERLEATVAERTAELRSANERMHRDLAAGSAYVRALIPHPTHGEIAIDWRYVPSSDLGGDTIGYHWLDDRHLALYLIDVTGHGLDSALLAVTVTNVIRSGSLSAVDMRRPDEVVVALNEAFQGRRHGHKFFTIWYGVYERESRSLVWSGGGHHPAVLFTRGNPAPVLLPASGPIMGAVTGMAFDAESCTVPPGSRLALFSDGVFEILRDDQVVWTLDDMIAYAAARAQRGEPLMDALLQHVRELRGSTQLDDDFSIIEAVIG